MTTTQAGIAGNVTEAATRLIEALDDEYYLTAESIEAMNSLDAALASQPAQPVQEPVSEQWCAYEDGSQCTSWYHDRYGDRLGWEALAERLPEKYQVVTRPLYAHPAPSQEPVAVVKALDDRLKEAGMFTVPEMMGVTPMSRWEVHTGIRDLDTFGQWLDLKASEYLRMKARYELGDKDKSDELYEWVLAHAGAYSTIRTNFKAALERSALVNAQAGKVEASKEGSSDE